MAWGTIHSQSSVGSFAKVNGASCCAAFGMPGERPLPSAASVSEAPLSDSRRPSREKLAIPQAQQLHHPHPVGLVQNPRTGAGLPESVSTGQANMPVKDHRATD